MGTEVSTVVLPWVVLSDSAGHGAAAQGMKNTLYLDLGDGYMGVYIYKNQSCSAYIPNLYNYLRFFFNRKKRNRKSYCISDLFLCNKLPQT